MPGYYVKINARLSAGNGRTGKVASALEQFDMNSEAGRSRMLQLHRHAQVGGCVSGIAHDINNLLGAAMAYAELVTYDEGVSPDSVKMLNNVIEGITKCSALVSSLTSISRKDRMDINLTSPEQLMDEALVLRDYELKIQRITVERDYQSDLAAIPADLAKLKLALLFLLINAQQALEGSENKQLKVSVGNTDGGIYFEIWDSGPGMSAELAEKAFDPYQTSWPDNQHMGLGLYSARRIAELHQGSLDYDAERGFRMFIKRDNGLLNLGN